jgi:hypothetical protein
MHDVYGWYLSVHHNSDIQVPSGKMQMINLLSSHILHTALQLASLNSLTSFLAQL